MEILSNTLEGADIINIINPKHLKRSKKNRYLRSKSNIVIHSTSSTYLKTVIKDFKDSDVKETMHIVIDRRGEITQLLPFNIEAHHVMDKDNNILKYKNASSIGITLLNAGRLVHVCGSYYMPNGDIIDNRSIMVHKQEVEDTSYWQTYPDAQINALIELCKTLTKKYPSIKRILENSETSKGKLDPGPAFPREKFNNSLKLKK